MTEQTEALDKMADNARELGLDYEPAQLQHVTGCTHPSLGACSLLEDGTAAHWGCVMCGTEFVPRTKPATPHNWSVGMSAQDVVQTLLMVGWKQVEIAEAIQLKQPNISRVASGQQDVRWQHMDVLRSLLDQTPPRFRNA